MKIITIKPGTKVKIVESKIRKINSFYIGSTGIVLGAAVLWIHRGKIRVRTKAKGTSRVCRWYPEELKVIGQIKLKKFSAWK